MLTLRPYQQQVLESLRAGFAAGHHAQMLVCPTGGGKTEMAISLMAATKAKGNRAAMVLDRVVLCNQTSERLDKYKIDHGVLQSGHWRRRPYEPIQVCSAQTLEKRGSFPGLSLLIVDEAHNTRRETVRFIKNNPHIRVVGLTATPFTRGLGGIYSNVVSSVTTRELVEAGSLAPLQVYIAREIDMSGATKVAGEWSQKDATARGMAITGDIVSEWVKKTHEIFGRPRKTVVFCAGVAHGQELAQQFAQAGYNFVNLSYRDDEDFKAEAIKDFSRPDTEIHGLIATDILTKGFDVPDVMIGISARPFSKSLAAHVQQMGRVMRAAPGKDFAVWLDHSGNYLRFLPEWEDVYANGVSSLDDRELKPRREPTQAEKEAAKCPKCSRVWPSHSDTCPSCGHVRERRSELVAVPGQLQALDLNQERVDRDQKQRWYSQLLTICQERGYQRGWVAHKYREKFGVWPRGLSQMHEPASAEVLGWLQSRQIARHMAQQKSSRLAQRGMAVA